MHREEPSTVLTGQWPHDASIGLRDRQILHIVDGNPLERALVDRAGVHISTVSRAVAGKYAQTPQGIHPLKFFFTSGTDVDSGGVESQASVKQRIVELVEAEDRKKPLSDDQLAEALKEKHGIRIARRTVTKYRKALGLPSSSQRKQF